MKQLSVKRLHARTKFGQVLALISRQLSRPIWRSDTQHFVNRATPLTYITVVNRQCMQLFPLHLRTSSAKYTSYALQLRFA
jgi:hypothetical protein